MIDFFVPGAPVAAGSKKAFPVHGRDGRTHVAVADDSGPKGVEWRAAIRHAAARAHPAPPLTGPLCLELEFVVRRPQGHRGKHGVRPSAPPYPTTRPDLLKLGRAIEDALTSVLWFDDAQVVVERLSKRYAAAEPIGVRIRVAPMLARPGELALGLEGRV
jgi:Holliday junction resolvase RusA-like endonuclease